MTAPGLDEDRIRYRIEQGAEFLDEIFPIWRKLINVEVLNLEHADQCILGQLYCNVYCFKRGKTLQELTEEEIDNIDWEAEVLPEFNLEDGQVWKYAFSLSEHIPIDFFKQLTQELKDYLNETND